ncbi:MAG TPA: 1-(5-phosphoribosyl)-5-[(5-phosphoribosylamino)methylideneamino] imidazole-4-carboxamide isomerase [Terriglobia bacterium]|nr:1-(5-phosphoribosyl)-5-[(5-phosphoribosylamino)methylideneamino] imidazole-4-carboxamide isomerase [Terriglobia bacterium]
MIIPCIDLMGGKVVQLVQGRKKALEADSPLEMLRKFAAFPEIQVIDLDAALGNGSNDAIVELLASRAVTRVGGGVRSADRARRLVGQGASRVIVGTGAFRGNGVNEDFLRELAGAIGSARVIVALDSKGGRIVVKGWREATDLEAEDVLRQLEPFCSGFLCTYVDREGTLKGTDLNWFRRLRAATQHELTAAGGIATLGEIRELTGLGIHCALGMAIYTGRLSLEELARLPK